MPDDSQYVCCGNYDARSISKGLGLGEGPDGAPAPWDAAYAEEVFNGERPFTKAMHGLPAFYQLAVVRGYPSAVDAQVVFQNEGHTVLVEFLNADGWPELTYRFLDISQPPHVQEDAVLRRPGELFLSSTMRFEYTGDLNPYGNPIKLRQLQVPILSASTVVGVMEEIQDPARPLGDSARIEVDVSGDGFWEPVATFGDWDRWFVRDRPGVPEFG